MFSLEEDTYMAEQNILNICIELATDAHDGQVRRYTGEPYILHPLAVSELYSDHGGCTNGICAAILHDTIEDTEVTFNNLVSSVGLPIAKLVLELTEFSVLEDGNRKLRKELDKRYLARASTTAQSIKLADLIDNSKSIIKYAKRDFANIYIQEMSDLISVLVLGDTELRCEATNIVNKYKISVIN